MTYLEYIIPAVALIIVQIIVSIKQQRVQDVRTEMNAKEQDMRFEMTIKEIREDLARLEKKQDAHNELIRRVAVLERDNETAFNRIDELRQDIRAKA